MVGQCLGLGITIDWRRESGLTLVSVIHESLFDSSVAPLAGLIVSLGFVVGVFAS